MPYAEYAIVDATTASIGVELRRVPLEKAALRAETHDWPGAPALLQGDLLLHYA